MFHIARKKGKRGSETCCNLEGKDYTPLLNRYTCKEGWHKYL